MTYTVELSCLLYLKKKTQKEENTERQKNLVLARVLARVSKLVIQKDFVGMAQYFRGHGRTETCVLGRCRNFLLLWNCVVVIC